MKNILTILFLLKYLLIISQNNNKKSSVVIEGGGEIKTEIKFNNSVKIGNQQTTTKNTKPTAEVKNNKPTSSDNNIGTTSNSLKVYSKFDFVAGEKVVALEDFSQTNVGDFPLRWNTNGNAEIVTLDGQAGKWLEISAKTTLLPEFIKSLPENFTFEFDLACSQPFSLYTQEFSIGFVTMQKPSDRFCTMEQF
jgi:OOP family OmpA-OmpF porin